ncbi:DUF3710 domain-containing protein [Streptomyces sp. WAC06614]|uniref:DUF3710 domain-containing protein n=1 Tax=Streptomyces sp. WAC06614 TaxID=2487416 RepID=UPI000F769CC2|nr:DUF3710 domain-containing protein [Streptomyces sp. WAC06614]RSS62183.1 DUF3710 domain-containing protein [Streptomyces sp. WAC06614]
MLSGPPVGLSPLEVDDLTEVLRGNLSAARFARESGVLTLDRVLALLVRVIADEAMTYEEVKALMESAREMNEEIVRAGDLLRPPYRGVDVDPWDVTETGWQDLDLLDLGGLRIPRRAARRLELNRLGNGSDYAEAVLLRDGTASLQLQAFRTSGKPEWEKVRGTLEADVRARGGEVEHWSGRAGVELRAVIPVVSDAHGRESMTVRFIGCDGPGWLLRGGVNGEVALPESRDEWAYSCFESVVVVPSFSVPSASLSISPGNHGSVAPKESQRVIPLRMPE